MHSWQHGHGPCAGGGAAWSDPRLMQQGGCGQQGGAWGFDHGSHHGHGAAPAAPMMMGGGYGQGGRRPGAPPQPRAQGGDWSFERGNASASMRDGERHSRPQEQRNWAGAGREHSRGGRESSWPFEMGSAGAASTDHEERHRRLEQKQCAERYRKDLPLPFERGSAGFADGGRSRSASRSRSRDRGLTRGSREGSKGAGGCGGKGQGEEDTSKDWYCNQCDSRNFAKRAECFKCKAAMPRTRSRSPDGRGGQSRTSGGRESSGVGTRASEGGYRGSDSGAKGKGSSFMDFGGSKGGGGGGGGHFSKGKADEDLSNDWFCESCDNRNFAKRDDCYKCRAPRPRHQSPNQELGCGSATGGGSGKGGGFPVGGGAGGKGGWLPGSASGGGGAGLSAGGLGGKAGGGGKESLDGDKPTSGEGSRDLFRDRSCRSPSGGSSRSGSSGSSSPAPKKKPRPRLDLWDSTRKAFEAPRPPPPPAMRKRKPMEMGIGARVDIFGLVGAAQYNGCCGRIVDGPNEKSRWMVQVERQAEAKTLALLQDNLRVKPTCGWEVVAAGLSNLASEEDITDAFAKCGGIVSAKVTRDLNGESKGVALIELASREAAEKALDTMQESEIRGRPIKVQWSTMVKQEMGLLKSRGEDEDEEDKSKGPRRSFHEGDEVQQPPSAEGPFKVGQKVNVSGLKSAPQYNGTVGIVQGFREDGRCQVLLQLDDDKKTLALKVENLSATVGDDLQNATAGPTSDGNAKKSVGGADPVGGGGSCDSGTSTANIGGATSDRAAASNASPGDVNASHGGHSQAVGSEGVEGAEGGERRRRRRSAWGEGNDGGEVYVGSSGGSGAATAKPPAPELPSPPAESDVLNMSAKELRQLLAAHKVDATGCIEKADLLAEARKLCKAS
eukprot:TRINITY_DN29505_c0_g1_i1.p1 TRINITY_DN29505_c0_g1~~TRINITY_DN29505_c0_g1_i1.p1  ORF type:complete len:894 (+),score=203.65 TRINITY_DN29505_c0_g1_i1:69-2750(+)